MDLSRLRVVPTCSALLKWWLMFYIGPNEQSVFNNLSILLYAFSSLTNFSIISLIWIQQLLYELQDLNEQSQKPFIEPVLDDSFPLPSRTGSLCSHIGLSGIHGEHQVLDHRMEVSAICALKSFDWHLPRINSCFASLKNTSYGPAYLVVLNL
jgi:hypothetical protein